MRSKALTSVWGDWPGKGFAFASAKPAIMKKLLLLAFVTSICCAAWAQEPTEGKVEYQKKEVPAAIIELPYPPKVVEGAIKDYLNKKGVKGSSTKGFQVYRGARLSEMDMQNSDVYFKVDRKSRKEKDASVVYLFATPENQNPVELDAMTYDLSASKDLLRDALPSVQANNLEEEISAQENTVKKAEKRYDKLVDDGRDLEKRIRKLQDDLEQNRRDIEKQRGDIDNQKRVLETMRSKRKTNLVSN